MDCSTAQRLEVFWWFLFLDFSFIQINDMTLFFIWLQQQLVRKSFTAMRQMQRDWKVNVLVCVKRIFPDDFPSLFSQTQRLRENLTWKYFLLGLDIQKVSRRVFLKKKRRRRRKRVLFFVFFFFFFLFHSAKVFIIDNSTDFDGKMNRVVTSICRLLGVPRPKQIDRKVVVVWFYC